MRFYDGIKTTLIRDWTECRVALIRAFDKASSAFKHSWPTKESMYLGGNPNDDKHVYRGVKDRLNWSGVHDTESYVVYAIRTQILTAWDESVRQGSTEFYDRQFADALFVWNQTRASEFPALPTAAPVAGEPLDNATSGQDGGAFGDGL